MQIAVGGCLAQKDRETIVRRAPWVDVVFGTHNVGALPVLLERARHNAAAQVEILESLEVFPSTLPARRESAYAGWVSISVGCNNTCTFCIVPSLRGTERDRRPGDVLAEVRGAGGRGRAGGDAARAERQLLRRGVRRPRRLREAAAGLRRRAGAGARPVHLAAPARLHLGRHRGDGADPERVPAAAHAAAVGVGPRPARDAPLVPVGAVPRDPRRGAGRDPRRGDLHRHHRRVPRRDRRRLRRDAATSSRRRGSPRRSPSSTPRGPAPRRPRCPTRCPRPWCRSATSGSSRCRRRSPGRRTGRSRGARWRCWSRRARAARTRRPGACPGVRATAGWCTSRPATPRIRPGDVVTVEVTYGAPHHLVADGPPLAHRRTRAGDAHEAGQRPTGPGGASTGLGLPGFGTPAPLPAAAGCAVGTGGGAG